MSTLREMWEEWKWSICIDPFEHLLTILLGFWFGMFAGASIMLAAVKL